MTSLIDAILDSKSAKVKAALKANTDVNETDSRGYPALQLAISKATPSIVKTLIAAGADLEATNNDGGTALHVAAAIDKATLAKALLAAGAKVDARDRFDATPLMTAAMHGAKKTVSLLMKNRADINAIDRGGRNALLHAVQSATRNRIDGWRSEGSREAVPVAYEIVQGQMYYLPGEGQRTIMRPVDARTVAGKHYKKGANLDPHGICREHVRNLDRVDIARTLGRRTSDLNVADEDGHTVLHALAALPDAWMLAEFAKKGADVEARTKDGRRPVHFLAGCRQTLTMVNNYVRDLDFSAVDKFGWTPLHYAAHCGDTEMIDRLPNSYWLGPVESTAERFGVPAGSTPLACAENGGHTSAVERLKGFATNYLLETVDGCVRRVEKPAMKPAPMAPTEAYVVPQAQLDRIEKLREDFIAGRIRLVGTHQSRLCFHDRNIRVVLMDDFKLRFLSWMGSTPEESLASGVEAKEESLPISEALLGELNARVRPLLEDHLACLDSMRRGELTLSGGGRTVDAWSLNSSQGVILRNGAETTDEEVLEVLQSGYYKAQFYDPKPEPEPVAAADPEPHVEPPSRGALSNAVLFRDAAEVRRFLEAGIDPSEVLGGWTVLQVAAERGVLDILVVLLDFGVDPNETMDGGWTPLHFVVQRVVNVANSDDDEAQRERYHREALDCAKALIEGGANLASELDGSRWTPLHLAAERGANGLVEVLLANGKGAVNAKDADGFTPLWLAVRHNQPKIAQALVNAGAEIDTQDASGFSPLHDAALENWADLVTILLEAGADPTLKITKGDDTFKVGMTAADAAEARGHSELAAQMRGRS